MNLFDKVGKKLLAANQEEISLKEYLDLCKKDPMAYATAAERLLHAIGDPKLIDTRKDERLSRIYSNETVPVYEGFKDIYGLELNIKELVSVIKHAAQGLEEKRQIFYLLGPVGSSKSTIAYILKRLMEKVPFYAIKGSPLYENPLSLFSVEDADKLGIPKQYLNGIPSRWLLKRVEELDGDISKLKVVKVYPSETHQIGISHIEAGDENNQDISVLVGKVNINRLGDLPQDDPDCYSYSGGLCIGNRGLVEFTEMFKAPPKTLNPLYEATQSRFYNGTENVGALPFEGIILAHSNESEWQVFRNNQRNEALIDRICLIKIPYCLRYTEEKKIYEKLLRESSLKDAPCAPKTLELLAKFAVFTRLIKPADGKVENKLEVYNGGNLKYKIPDIKSVWEYQKEAHDSNNAKEEGFFGISTRFAFKVLSQTFNMDVEETAANPLYLLTILSEKLRQESLSKEDEVYYSSVVEYLAQEYLKYFDSELKKAYIDAYDEHGQSIFDKYFLYADSWLNDEDFRDPLSNLLMKSEDLDKYLESVEVPAGISNKKDFRNEIVKYCLRYRSQHDGKNPKWTAYQKIRDVIESKVFSNLDDMLPIISSSTQASHDDRKRHKDFVDRMVANGYTEKQVRVLIDWFIKSNRE